MARATGLLRFLALGLAFVACRGEYNANSILCDDIEAICIFEDLPFVQNDTVCGNKQEFLNPTKCNCGSMCISYLEEGDECFKSSQIYYPQKLCGPGLECMTSEVEEDKDYCVRNPAKKCINETLRYEEAQEAGTLGPGEYKPNCDEFGRYASRQCSPGSTCYCVNKDGERLFGEAPVSEKDNVDCACSTYWEETESRGLNTGLRCLPNGNFDELQCADKMCFCFDFTSGTISFGPFPDFMMEDLPCYDVAIHGSTYQRPCEKALEEWESNESEDVIIIQETARPVCNHDGYFAAIQYKDNYVFCSDFYGRQIEDFHQEIHLADGLTCNCARRRYIMEENGFGSNKPKCCGNGDYTPVQTRGLLAYCVDSNGNQSGPEVEVTDITTLPCYSEDPCEN
ncbi:uncharacterized protein LOC122262672 isoform X2 [Penaeus japonicus]|nr:uncharacterized protein LOC122262672 isoform X2 [Penaeus japonicus]